MPISLAHETSPFDNVFTCGSSTSSSGPSTLGGATYSPTLDLWVATGGNCLSATSIATSPGNGVWTSRGNPWGAPQGGFGGSVVWAEGLGKFIAVGSRSVTGTCASATSTTGMSWTIGTDVPGGALFLTDVFWSETLGQALAIASGGATRIYRSTDGLTWTACVTPAGFSPSALAYRAGVGWVAVGLGVSGPKHAIATSPDGITWTSQSSAFSVVGWLTQVIWSDTLGKFLAVGRTSPAAYDGATSSDGVTWTPFTGGPWDNPPVGLVDFGGAVAVASGAGVSPRTFLYFSRDVAEWEIVDTVFDTLAASEFLPCLAYGNSKLLVIGVPGGAETPGIYAGLPVAPPLPNTTRFFEGYPWRFIFADVPTPNQSPPSQGGVTTTWAQGILTSRSIAKTLNQPTTISCSVWPDDARANETFTDDFPVIAPNNRVIYAFRREGGSPPWKIRAAAILMTTEDQGDPDVPLSHLTAYDPWQYLMGRPCVDTDGEPPTTAYGFQFTGQTGDWIARRMLSNSIDAQGFAFIDAGTAWGGTAYYGGTIETTDELVFTVQQGATVGEVWQQLCDTGTMDIVLTPIYDPSRRPGYTHELNIYRLAGDNLPGVVFGWDKMNRALTTIDRLHSGTPGDMVNQILYFAGQGAPVGATLVNDASVDVFGVYWSTQAFPALTLPGNQTPQLLAAQALRLGKQGKRTLTVNPTPERAPVPLTEYDVGDRVGVWTSRRLRVASSASFLQPTQAQRVEVIPIVIDDDGIERIQAMITSPDYRTSADDPELTPDVVRVKNLGTATAVTTSRRRPRKTISRLRKPLT